ncbi:MAG: 5,6-dimethylbenzimidazole synthase [Hyphomicrobiales bacterium]|nr:5,6-dimethylbenzimidazole synthase [Hyphomicrobiales bacterium]
MTTRADPPMFDAAFQAKLALLIAWRRDVRRFRDEAVPQAMLDHLLDLVQLSPSVGNSQPWRIVSVTQKARRAAIRANFEQANAAALQSYQGERAALYARLKLSGLDIAPVHWAIFCDHATRQGQGLGTATMPEMLDASVSGMIATLWLAARAQGLGLGWVSILDPRAATATLDVPSDWKLIAYLCIGWPQEEHADPELVRFRWQNRTLAGRQVLER